MAKHHVVNLANVPMGWAFHYRGRRLVRCPQPADASGWVVGGVILWHEPPADAERDPDGRVRWISDLAILDHAAERSELVVVEEPS